MNLKKKKIGENLCGLELGKNFLNTMPYARSIKKKNYEVTSSKLYVLYVYTTISTLGLFTLASSQTHE